MEDIRIKRFKGKPVKGIIEPADGSWSLAITDQGPTLMVAVKFVADDGTTQTGMLDVRDIPEGTTVAEVMTSTFLGKVDLGDDDVINVHGIPTRIGDMKADPLVGDAVIDLLSPKA